MKEPAGVLRSPMLWITFLFGCTFALGQTRGSGPGSAGWYTAAQAANGAKVYQRTCASCHGAKLQGAMGPALTGKQFWLTYGGKKVSTLWSEVHTEMPMMAAGSVSAKNSTDVMAFLLQKNGVPAGTAPLNDKADLSRALPSK
ncbi:MAG: c-type cytochrome [Candidatus Acidiferrales bacterium]